MRKIALFAFLLLVLVPIASAQPVIGGCNLFPADNPWNTDISNAPVHPNSAKYIAYINAHGGDNLHPDFGSWPEMNEVYGIPWITVDGSQPLVDVNFEYADESEPGAPGEDGYPIPPDAPVEGDSLTSGDRHVIVVRTSDCMLFETWASVKNADDSWDAGSGAIFDLNSNDLRPDGWTSADAAGLPILPGLARCDEAMIVDGIQHALRFTVGTTQRAYVYPATHYASNVTDPNAPPMGLRLRLKANYNMSGLTGQAREIAKALKRYGMILADNGSNWYISGEENPDCWNNDELNQLKNIPGTAFEVIVSPPPPKEDSANLLNNAGFEAAYLKPINPLNWAFINRTGEARACNYLDATNPTPPNVTPYGQCALRFKASASENSVLRQVVKGQGSKPAGTVYTIEGLVKANNLQAKRAGFRARITYDDGVVVNRIGSFFPAGTYDYTLITATFTAAKPIKSLEIRVIYKGTAGTVWIDNLSLKDTTSPRNWIPLPAAP